LPAFPPIAPSRDGPCPRNALSHRGFRRPRTDSRKNATGCARMQEPAPAVPPGSRRKSDWVAFPPRLKGGRTSRPADRQSSLPASKELLPTRRPGIVVSRSDRPRISVRPAVERLRRAATSWVCRHRKIQLPSPGLTPLGRARQTSFHGRWRGLVSDHLGVDTNLQKLLSWSHSSSGPTIGHPSHRRPADRIEPLLLHQGGAS
jgi:hypothetical protein